jgi:IS605 OrfB family transposase
MVAVNDSWYPLGVRLVVKLKLVPDAEQAAALLLVMERFNAACDWLAGKAFGDRTANKYLLQRRYYGPLRRDFGLGAQMAVRVIAKVSEAYKRDRKIRPRFRPRGAIVYDQRNSRILGVDRMSLSTLAGRTVVPYVFGAYQRPLLERLKGQIDLVYDRGARTFFAYATADVPVPDASPPEDVLGVDLGIVNLAADSDGTTYAGAVCNGLRRRHHRLRRRLQAKGTRPARRLLRRRRRRERRYQADVNHTISKRLVQTAAATHRAVALENLEGIRTRGDVRRGQRRVLHGWAFAQLRAFVEYKAARAGVPVYAVDPRHTSQTCPRCGLIDRGNRPTRNAFRCVSCGFAGPADTIAAANIARRGRLVAGLPVSQPDASAAVVTPHRFLAPVASPAPPDASSAL